MRRAALLSLLGVAAAGCGTPSPDLFVVEREGTLPDAKLELVVVDDGQVKCDGEEQPISDDVLLDARQLERELAPLLEEDLTLPIPPDSLLRYRVLSDEGVIRFADRSPNIPPELGKLVQFTRKVAREACKRAR